MLISFVWPLGWFGLLWIGGAVDLVFDLRMPFLCLINFWELFVDGFEVEAWPGIIISFSNVVGPYFLVGNPAAA